MTELKDRLSALTPEQRHQIRVRLAKDIAGTTERAVAPNGRPVDFTLFFFSADGTSQSRSKYELLLRCTEFGDANGFKAIWTPERHFTQFGGLYPNPAVLGAALATRTEHIEIRAGSVVLPMHNPVALAEDWSIVDNLSNGRVGLGFAAGWNKRDFALRPEAFATRRESMSASIDLIKRLWRGESVRLPGVDGELAEIVTFPRPMQPELRYWLTCKTEEGWTVAGATGANVLAMMGSSKPQLAQCIGAYRKARADAGLPAEEGTVSVMLHTYVDNDIARTKAKTRGPLQSYLEEFIQQFKSLADESTREQVLANKDALLDFAFERYFEQASLLGPQTKCHDLLNELTEFGVNEIACLIDFGVDDDDVINSLELLAGIARQRQLAAAACTATLDPA